MSKFESIIEVLQQQLTPAEKERKKNQNVVDAAVIRVQQGSKDPTDLAIAKQSDTNKKKALQAMRQMPTEAEEDEVAQDPDSAPVEPQADTLSPEGEVFYVDLIKKALFVDLDNIELSPSEKETVTHDVTPENAKEVANVLQKIINDFGLGV